MSDARRYAIWPNPRSRSHGVESWKFFHFQNLSSAIFNGGWQMIADYFVRGQYLNFVGPDF